MKELVAFVSAVLMGSAAFAAGPALVVADEIPAMQVLAAKLKAAEGIETRIVTQDKMPADLSAYPILFVYIHKDIAEATENAAIAYANAGGRLILLHHSISSGKRKNKEWLPFLGVKLPEGNVDEGGYKWIDPVDLEIANIAPKHFITTHNVRYDAKVEYKGEKRPGFALKNTEVYLNHVFEGPRTILLGLKYTDPKAEKVWTQDTAGWYRPAGKGWVFYFMAGHNAAEFEQPAYAQIVTNAAVFKVR